MSIAIAAAVNCLASDATLKADDGVIGRSGSRFARPKPRVKQAPALDDSDGVSGRGAVVWSEHAVDARELSGREVGQPRRLGQEGKAHDAN